MIWLRAALFGALAPGTILILLPFVLVTRGIGPRLDLGTWRLSGLVPLAMGLTVILWCFVDFIQRGRGTPAPYEPPRRLVVGGLYRFVRNPQYIGLVLVMVGEALLAGAIVLFGYAALLAVRYHLVVKYYEEPILNRRFGEAYGRYCKAVRGGCLAQPGATPDKWFDPFAMMLQLL